MRFSVFRETIALYCLLSAGALAQISPPAAGSGVIAGIVVETESNTAIRRAIVTLITVEAQPQEAVAWTDGNGRFSFGYLPAGRYQLRVAKDGFLGVVYGAERPRRPPAIIQLDTGQVRNDFVFRLQLVSFITGVVLDEDGDPLNQVQVMGMRSDFQRGKRKLLPGPMAVTDGNGRYRLSGLPPGQYAVVALRQNGPVVRMHPEATAGEMPQQYLYGVQYYPAGDRAEAATLVSVQPGDQISQIDFRLAARPAVSMEGKIIVPPGATSVKDAVLNVTNEGYANRFAGGAGLQPPEYAFNFGQLSPGSYVLIARASVDGKQYRGVQTIELGSQGLKGLAIPLEPAIDLSGSVSIEGPGAAKYAAASVNLTPGDGIPWNAPPLRANVNKDGSFKIAGVPPGIWDIGVSPIPPGGYLKSMRLGDQDVLTEEMMIRPSTTEPLKIVLSTRAAAIEGDVEQFDRPSRCIVLLAPDGKFRNVVSFYRFAATDDKGHFEIKNATPGEYRLYAFDEMDPRSIQDPDFLKPFEKYGTQVVLREGPNDSQKLSLVPADSPGARP